MHHDNYYQCRFPCVAEKSCPRSEKNRPGHAWLMPLCSTDGRCASAGASAAVTRVDTVVVMLDGGAAFQSLDPKGLKIWWGAYLGMPDQIIMAGSLAEVGAQIVEARRIARDSHGWIMDSYILKRVTA